VITCAAAPKTISTKSSDAVIACNVKFSHVCCHTAAWKYHHYQQIFRYKCCAVQEAVSLSLFITLKVSVTTQVSALHLFFDLLLTLCTSQNVRNFHTHLLPVCLSILQYVMLDFFIYAQCVAHHAAAILTDMACINCAFTQLSRVHVVIQAGSRHSQAPVHIRVQCESITAQ